MFKLDNKPYATVEEASKATGIAKSTLENHLPNGTWKSKKGIEHTIETINDEPLLPTVPSIEEGVASLESPDEEDPILSHLAFDRILSTPLENPLDHDPFDFSSPRGPVNQMFVEAYSAK